MPDDGFVAFVRGEHEGLLCVADLLEEHPHEAERLVRNALVDTRMRWREAGRDGGPAAYARGRLLRRHCGRRPDRKPPSGFVPEPTSVDVSSEALRLALADLPPRTRAAVVLRLYEGLPDEEIARLLRTDRETALDELTRGRAQLERSLALESAGAGASSLAPTDLGAELRLRVERVARPPFDPVATAASISREAATGRRRCWLIGIVGALAAAVGTGAVLFDDPPVVRRWALAVGASGSSDPRGGPDGSGDLLQVWFTGPPGAAPDRMTMSSFPLGVSTDVPVALMDARTGVLVVVAAPSDAVEVSERPVIAADGSRSRPYAPADTTDGIATTRIGIGGIGHLFALSYRVLRGGAEVPSAPPEWVMTSVGPDVPVVDISYPRGVPGAEAVAAAQAAALAVLGPLGLPLEGTDVVASWAGPLSGPVQGALAVVRVKLPSGAAVVTVQWQSSTANGDMTAAGDCGLDIRPAGVATEEQVLAAGCDVYSATTGAVVGLLRVVLAPLSVTALRAYDARGRLLADLPVPEDGVLIVAKPPGTAEAEAEIAGGVLLGRTDLMVREQLLD